MNTTNASNPTAIIVDDEPLLRAQVRDTLRAIWPELDIVAEAGLGEQAIMLVDQHQPDFAFLDIEMPGMNGLEVAAQVKGKTHVVFVTAYNQYALDAFDRGAVDYVLKPASEMRLLETVNRLKARLQAHSQQAAINPGLEAVLAQLRQSLLGGAAAPRFLEMVQASLGNQTRMIQVADVLYFQSDAKYTKVVTHEHESLLRKPLKELLDELNPNVFWQVHRGTVVNTKHIAEANRDDDGKVTLNFRNSKETVEVSRTYSHLFKGE
jgi:DNA-binding LytR/AlgR family response regulator